jgi:hypothetical protein
VAIGKYIAGKAGYRRMVLELGGNDPIIVMDDADLDEASTLAVPALQELRPALHGRQAHAGARGGGRALHRAGGGQDPRLELRRPMDKTRNDMGTVIDEPRPAAWASRPGAVQHRHRTHRVVVRRPGPGGACLPRWP